MNTVTDRSLPHASTVANAVITDLTHHGYLSLARQVEDIHDATCDLAHAVWAERNAPEGVEKTDASLRISNALTRLRGP